MAEKSLAQVVVSDTEKKIHPLVQATENMVISDNDQYVAAGEILKKVKSVGKNFKAEKDRVLKPVNDLVKAYEATLKPVETTLKDMETNIKAKMLEYNRVQTAEAQKKAEALDRKVESGYIKNPETMMRNMASIETPNNAEAGVIVSMVKKVRITDMSKIPAEYFGRPKVVEALMVELRKDALGNKAQNIAPIAIPGTEVYEEESMSA